MKNPVYNPAHHSPSQDTMMPSQDFDALTDFGKRLSTLRKKAGYTQVELAKELNVTQRMISYYEGQSEYPPCAMLPKLVSVLNVSSDELLGIKPLKKKSTPDTRLMRRVAQIEKLGAAKKRQLLQIIDTFIEVEKLKK